jgi:hypothetical protein
MERVLGGSTRSWVNQSRKLERPLSNGTGHDGEGRSLKRGPFYICGSGRGREEELLWVLHFFSDGGLPLKRNLPMTSPSTEPEPNPFSIDRRPRPTRFVVVAAVVVDNRISLDSSEQLTRCFSRSLIDRVT